MLALPITHIEIRGILLYQKKLINCILYIIMGTMVKTLNRKKNIVKSRRCRGPKLLRNMVL